MRKLLYTLAAVLVPSLAMAQTYTENFIMNTTYQVETTTGSVSADEKIEAITYFDGLGRPMQSIAKQAGGNKQDIITPVVYDDFGRQVKDYLPYANPNQTSGANLDYRQQDPSFFTAINTRYLAKFPADINAGSPNPFSEKHLEASPLNRVLEQGAPGADWAVNKSADTDHTIKFGYGTNTVSDHVRRFSVSFQNGDTKIPQLVEDTEMVYDPSELYKTVTRDENWKPNQTYPKDHTTEEYKDKQGRVVLKRTFDSKRWLDTYYVYDDYGNLTYVVPPKVMTYSSILQPYIEQEFVYDWDLGEVFVNNSGYGNFSIIELDGKLDVYWYFGGKISSSVFKNFVIPLNFTPALPNMAIGTINGESGAAASVFIQDGNLHIQSTGIPVGNADLEEYILLDLTDYQSNYTPSVIDTSILNGLCYQYRYDLRNRLIEKKIPGKGTETDWEEIVYNKLNQPILTRDPNLKAQGKWLFTKYDAFGRVVYTGTMNSTSTRINLQSTVNGHATQYETKNGFSTTIAGTPVYYGNDSYPQTISEVYTINYYDDYTFDGFTSMPSSIDGQLVINHNNYSSTQKLTKGLATASKVRVLGTNPVKWITTISGYDTKGRAIYFKSVNDYLGTTEVIESTLDFTGKVVKSVSGQALSGQYPTIVEDYYIYDHMGRLKKQTQVIQSISGASTPEVIVENTYDELGQLTSKGVGGKSTQGRLQTVDYSYNIRGWLKQINDPTSLGNDLFTFKLNYNTPGHGATALYNGNISETEWRTANIDSALKWYKYSYDAINRLTQARDNANQYFVGGYYSYSPFIKYDRNGNIKSLTRSGFNEDTNTYAGVIDNLNYMYADNSNQLLKVTDVSYGAAKVFGFNDGNVSGDDYDYDTNGNMVKDLNKGIGDVTSNGIVYNHLNLPTSVSINGSEGNGTISYIYDATGVKLEKKVEIIGNPNPSYTYYAGNYVYEGSSLKFFNHPEGYVDAVNGYKYVYQYKDHLGNIKLSYQDTNGNYKHILDSDFTDSFDGWEQNGSVNYSLDNGRLKANINSAYEGVKHYLNGFTTTAGEVLNVSIIFDKGNTQSNIRLYLHEVDPNGNLVNYNVKTSNLQTGSYEFSHTMVNTGNSIIFRIDKENTNTTTETYFYIDHVSLTQNNLEILEENNYYPFGLEHKGYNKDNILSTNIALKRKFGGKEYQDELGLNWYDITARNYDPAIGRWMNLDPLAEQMRRHSPYNYAFDNPIFFIDADGMAPDDIYIDEKGNYLGEDGAVTNNVRVIYGGDFNQVKSDNSGSTISLKATAKLQSLSSVVTIDESKIQNDINDVNNETINDQSVERQTYITLNIDSKSAGNPTAVVTSQRGADGNINVNAGNAVISSQTTQDGRNTIGGSQNVLIGGVHSHNNVSSTTTTTTGNVTTITTRSNIPGTSQADVNASNNLGIPIYSIDSYHGNPAISVPAPFVGGAGPAMHRVSNGVQTNNIGTTATQNVGQDALSKYIKRITP